MICVHGFWYKIIILLLEIVIIIFYYLFQRYVASLVWQLIQGTSFSLVPCGVHIKPLEREEWTNVVSSFKVAQLIWKLPAQMISRAPFCFIWPWQLYQIDPVWPWNMEYLKSPASSIPTQGEKTERKKISLIGLKDLARLQIWSGAQDWMYRGVSQLNWTWSNGWFQCNSINLIFVETIKKFKCCIHKLHLGLNGGIFPPTSNASLVALQIPIYFSFILEP